jgi:uncharacterized protein (DUF697 family)
MGITGSLARHGGRFAAPRIGKIAPGFTSGFLQKVLARAIAGVGPLDGAAEVADKALAEENGNVHHAVDALIRSHTRLSGAQGFVTNIGGLVTMAVTVPANVTGLVMVQLRLHAAIARLYGHDLDDLDVRAAVLTTLLGHEQTEKLVRKGDLPGNARWLLKGDPNSQETMERVSAQVAATLVGFLGGKQLATLIGKRVPLFGGVVGAATDARATKRLGRDAARDLPQR